MATDKNLQIVISAKDKTASALSSVKSGLSSISATATGLVSAVGASALALGALGGVGLKMAGNFEQTAVAFETIIWSASEAKAVLSDLSKFAAQTPFEFPELANASKMLMAFGVGTGEIIDTMRMLGDVASGVGIPLERISLAYGQVLAKGKLQGGELMQFTEAGIPIVETLSQQLGVSTEKFYKLVEGGKISAEQVKGAFEQMTGAGGKFYGMMAKQSTTLNGLFSTASDYAQSAIREIIGISDDGSVRVGSLFDMARNGLADALAWIDENKGTIIETAVNMTEWIGLAFSSLGDFLGEIWTFVSDVFTGVLELFGINTQKVGQGIAMNWKNVFQFIASALAGLALVFGNVFSGVKLGFKLLLSVVTNGAKSLAGFAVFIVGAALSPIQDIVNGAINGVNVLLTAVGKAPLGLVDFADKVGDVGAKIMSSAWTSAQEDGLDAWDAHNAKVLENTQKYASKMDAIVLSMAPPPLEKYVPPTIGKAKPPKIAGGGSEEDAKKKSKEAKDAEKKAEKELMDVQKARYDSLKSSMTDAFGALQDKISSSSSSVKAMKDEYVKLGEQLKKVGTDGAKELEKLDSQLAKSAQKIAEITGAWQGDVAKRTVEAEKELSELKKATFESTKEVSGEEYQANLLKIKALEAEVALGQQYAGNKALQDALVESKKSEVQLIIDKTAKTLADAQAERAELQKTRDQKLADIEAEKASLTLQMEEKKAKILEEHNAYLSLLRQRRQFDSQYFGLFQEHIAKQILKTKEAINLMDQLAKKGGLQNGQSSGIAGARADGWPVSGGKTYLVGERWPELFTPSRSGQIIPNGGGGVTLNVTIGNVSASDRSQVDHLVERIKTELTREIRLAKVGLA